MKWRRASLAAASIESPPPLVRKTLAPGIGARSASLLAQLVRGPVSDVGERVVGLEPAHLRRDGVGDLGAAVADVRVPQRRRGIEVALVVGVEDPRALAALDHELVLRDRGHVREGVPEGHGAST